MAGALEQIAAFLAVAEAQSFSRAATTLGVAPSSVTRTVSELERRLGVQLLVRTTRRVSLTQAGTAFRAQVTPLVDGLAQAQDGVRAYQTTLTGTLRVSVPLSFGLHALSDPLIRFRAEAPDIEMQISLTDRFVDILTDDLDMALRISGAPDDLSTIWRKIAPVPRSMVASPDYLSRHGTPLTPADLQRHSGLAYAHLAQGEVWQLTDPASGLTAPVRVPATFTCDNGDLLAQLAVAGQGIALLPDFLLRDAIAAGRLVRLLPDWQPPQIWLTAYFPPYRRLPAALNRFTACIEGAMGVAPL
ncbi:transcriptional regulator, LysR family [Loktanella fryxellensis]|uniref:Transcriptional regulator, LysR family n=1 Tax=Loktanella fryxellensis TaxID=245187 RepID=A0A1H8CUC3_9RHOB|nr:LysR family transcriptional regulator [Loktanella fryxellensis]SEM98723.1 transcriptional regulator, LysR family [Loktanella fryxellensis]